jgi:hypothetical protein
LNCGPCSACALMHCVSQKTCGVVKSDSAGGLTTVAEPVGVIAGGHMSGRCGVHEIASRNLLCSRVVYAAVADAVMEVQLLPRHTGFC